jgi:hypothetical protein
MPALLPAVGDLLRQQHAGGRADRRRPALEARCGTNSPTLQTQHPGGFLVRLHVLGDFYSVRYAELWHEALEAYPALHIFGYTAREPRARSARSSAR